MCRFRKGLRSLNMQCYSLKSRVSFSCALLQILSTLPIKISAVQFLICHSYSLWLQLVIYFTSLTCLRVLNVTVCVGDLSVVFLNSENTWRKLDCLFFRLESIHLVLLINSGTRRKRSSSS